MNTTQENPLQNEQTSQPSTAAQPQSSNYANRTPIAVYNDCKSTLRTDLNEIDTFCNTVNLGQKRFTFNLPTVLQQALQPKSRTYDAFKIIPTWCK